VTIRRGEHNARSLEVLARPAAVACDRRQLRAPSCSILRIPPEPWPRSPKDLAQY
jgi:hypothetical protein